MLVHLQYLQSTDLVIFLELHVSDHLNQDFFNRLYAEYEKVCQLCLEKVDEIKVGTKVLFAFSILSLSCANALIRKPVVSVGCVAAGFDICAQNASYISYLATRFYEGYNQSCKD